MSFLALYGKRYNQFPITITFGEFLCFYVARGYLACILFTIFWSPVRYVLNHATSPNLFKKNYMASITFQTNGNFLLILSRNPGQQDFIVKHSRYLGFHQSFGSCVGFFPLLHCNDEKTKINVHKKGEIRITPTWFPGSFRRNSTRRE